MSATPAKAGEAVQDAALEIVRYFDSEQATRFAAALEALSSNTHLGSVYTQTQFPQRKAGSG